MNPFNPIAAVFDGLKVHPEPMQLPDALVEATPQELAEARSRLQQIGQVANELRKLIDQELAGVLQGGAMRYGDTLLRPAGDRGSAKVRDDNLWWSRVVEGLQGTAKPELLLEALYPASSVRLGALPKLASVLGENLDDFRASHIIYDPPTAPLSVMPMSKAPRWAQRLEDGQLSHVKADAPVDV